MSGKLKVTMDMHMGKYGCDLSGPGILKSDLPQGYIEELLHVAIIVPMKCRIKTKLNSWGMVFHV